MKKTGLWNGAGAVVGVAAMGAAVYASTDFLVKVAMDRQLPNIHNLDRHRDRLRGYLNCDKFLAQMSAQGEKLKNASHKTVHIRGRDGQTLVGHLFACPEPKRIILAMHGWRSSWYSDFGMIADFWHAQGCSVLYAEQRGQGNSGGSYMGFGLTERYDCLMWSRWLASQFHLPIYLAGVSMGATTVLMVAGLKLPESVRGIMADCGFTSVHSIWKHVAEKNLHLQYRMHSLVADRLYRERLQIGTGDYSTLDAMKVCKVPVLFIHGTEDHFVPVEMTYENYQACKAPKSLLIVPGADHGMSFYREPQRYQQTMIDFWRAIETKPI